MKIIFYSLILIVSYKSIAQDHVPTPQTWDFMAAGRVPVSHFNGTLNYNLPLYVYKDKDFEIPATLYYNSAGFVPSKPASTVGLNWALNIGGVITRQVKGVPDEIDVSASGNPLDIDNNGFWFGIHSWPYIMANNNNIYNLQAPCVLKILPYGNYKNYCIVDPNNSEKYFEVQQDIFTFNFMGYHGKFMLDFDGTAKVFENPEGASYKIDMSGFKPQSCNPNLMDCSEIIITTNDGYKYYFGGSISNLELFTPASLIQGNYYVVSYPASYYVSWYLRKILAPNGRIVEFNYRNYPNKQGNPIAEFASSSQYGYEPLDGSFQKPLGEPTSFNFEFWVANSLPAYLISHYYLYDPDNQWFGFLAEKYIQSSAGPATYKQYTKTVYLEDIMIDGKLFLDINYSLKDYSDIITERCSYRNLKIDWIKILNPNGQELKNIQLSYIYASNRMFLDHVNVSGQGNFEFTYDYLYSLPNADTKNLDHWGFWNCNQSTANASLIPEFYRNDVTGDENIIKSKELQEFDEEGVPYYSLIFGLREPHQNTTFTQAGMLIKIKYPTGGETRITYEPHSYKNMVDRRAIDSFLPKLYSYDDNKAYYNSHLPNDFLPERRYTKFENLVNNYVGGVRVKQIEDFDGITITNKREFIYKTDVNGQDAGILLDNPRYHYNFYQIENKHATIDVNHSSGVSVNCFDEHICYSTVFEKDYNGYLKYVFATIGTNSDDIGQNTYNYMTEATNQFYPITLISNLVRVPNSHAVERGKLLSMEYYDKNKVRFKSITYEYEPVNTNNYIASVKASQEIFYSYKNYLSSFPLKKTITNTYDLSGNLLLEDITNFTYNNLGLRSQTETIRGSDALKTQFSYPSDYILNIQSSDPNYNALVSLQNKNILNKSVETKTSRNNLIINSELVKYIQSGNIV